MAELYLRDVNDTSTERVDSTHPLPVKDVGYSPSDRLFVATANVAGICVAAIYAANDAVGTPFSVDVPKAGWITGFKLIDPDDDTLALTAHVYSQPFVGAASDAAYTVAAGFARYWVTNVTFSTAEDEGGFKVSGEGVDTVQHHGHADHCSGGDAHLADRHPAGSGGVDGHVQPREHDSRLHRTPGAHGQSGQRLLHW